MDFDYKKYSLEQLDNWMHDALSSAEATPQEIYDVIRGVVEEQYYYFKEQTSRCYELLALLNSGVDNNKYQDYLNKVLTCDNDDTSEECKKSWTSFWEDTNNWSGGHKGSTVSSVQYTEEELNAMCDKAASDQEKEKCREYNLREAEYYDKRAKLDSDYEKVKRWILPTEVDGLTGDVIVNLPDDLLEAANLKEGDQVEWIDNGEGSYIMKKVSND